MKENREMKRGEGGEREKKDQRERSVSHSQTLTQKVFSHIEFEKDRTLPDFHVRAWPL